MEVFVFAEEDSQNKIEYFIRNSQLFFGLGEPLCFRFPKKTDPLPEQYDRAVVDSAHLSTAGRLHAATGGPEGLYLWAEGILISLENPALLDTLQQRALAAKNWTRVKYINHLKIEINHALKKTALNAYPAYLQLESTSFCNAQCIMCSHYYAGNQGALDMNRNMLDKLSELFPYLDVVVMHGNGEPLCSPMFEPCVETYAEYDIRLATNTNLSILTDRQIELINRCFRNVRVSCDACTKEIYEGIRRNLSFARFTDNLAKLRDRCPNVSKAMASVLMRQNLQQLPEMVDFAADYGFEEIIFSNLGTSLIVGNERDSATCYPYYTAYQLRQASERGQTRNIRVTIPNVFDLSLDDETMRRQELEQINAAPYFQTAAELEHVKTLAAEVTDTEERRLVENLADCYWEDHLYPCQGICEWCIERPYIDLKGDVFLCCINASYRVGNIFDYDSFLDLWNNELYQRVRNLFYSGQLPGFCNNCQFILNGTLKRLTVPDPPPEFYQRRRVSKFYHDYCGEEHQHG